MKLEELNYVLKTMYGFDMWKKGRKRAHVYARKVYCRLAHEMGYGPTEIMRSINNPAFKHDTVLYHVKSFNVVNPIDLYNYNACIDYFNLPIIKVGSINELIYGEELAEVIKDLSKLNRKDLKFFKEEWIPKFKKKLEMEKRLNNM